LKAGRFLAVLIKNPGRADPDGQGIFNPPTGNDGRGRASGHYTRLQEVKPLKTTLSFEKDGTQRDAAFRAGHHPCISCRIPSRLDDPGRARKRKKILRTLAHSILDRPLCISFAGKSKTRFRNYLGHDLFNDRLAHFPLQKLRQEIRKKLRAFSLSFSRQITYKDKLNFPLNILRAVVYTQKFKIQ